MAGSLTNAGSRERTRTSLRERVDQDMLAPYAKCQQASWSASERPLGPAWLAGAVPVWLSVASRCCCMRVECCARLLHCIDLT